MTNPRSRSMDDQHVCEECCVSHTPCCPECGCSELMLDDYQRAAMRTNGDFPPREFTSAELMLWNAAAGLCGESGELIDHIKKVLFHGHELDRDHVRKELGDILWYVAQGCEALGVSMEGIAATNIAKLRQRYPDGFSSGRSRNRGET